MKTWLSIIIPVYNVEKYIRQCLDSIVVEQTSVPDGVEVIIVDDGATDQSGKIAQEYEALSSEKMNIKVIHKKNAGVAAARNTGMDLAVGEWLYFVDADDYLEKECLKQVHSAIMQNDSSDIILFDAFQNEAKKQSIWEHFDSNIVFSDKKEIYNLQRGVLYFPMLTQATRCPLAAPWDKVYRRGFILEYALHFQKNLKVLDDMIFNMEAFGEAKRVSYVKEKIYHYRYVANSITHQYKPNRVEQDMKVWECIEHYIVDKRKQWNEEQVEKFLQAYYCRIIKSFSICCGLQFFAKQNEKSLSEKVTLVKTMWNQDPFQTAFRTVKLKNAEWKLKCMIACARMHWGYGAWLLYQAQAILTRLK